MVYCTKLFKKKKKKKKNGACRTLVPIAREDGAWWGVPPLRSKIGRRTKGARTGGESGRTGQCGTANLHCSFAEDGRRVTSHDLDRANWRIHPLLAQLGVRPYNCLIAGGPFIMRLLEDNIWHLREALWTQELRRLREHLEANVALGLREE